MALAAGVALCGCSNGSDAVHAVTADEKEASLAQVAAAAPPGQIEAFADGEIDDAEYSAAILQSYDCFTTALDETALPAGVEIDVRSPERLGSRLNWSFGLGGSDENTLDEVGETLEAIDGDCRQRYSNSVAEAFFIQSIPIGEERDQMLQQLIECAEGLGVDLPDNFTLTKIDQIEEDQFSTFSSCADQFPELFIAPRPS